MKALTALGVEKNRVRAAGYGAHCAADPGETEEAKEKNRRVEIKIMRLDGKDTGVELACAPRSPPRASSRPACPRPRRRAPRRPPTRSRWTRRPPPSPRTRSPPLCACRTGARRRDRAGYSAAAAAAPAPAAPAAAKPATGRPRDADAKPAAAKPADTKPAETKPASVK